MCKGSLHADQFGKTTERKMEYSNIEWTTHTFNPWIGCQHVSPGCDHCYAEAMMDHRYGKLEWGRTVSASGPRSHIGKIRSNGIRQPVRLNESTAIDLVFFAHLLPTYSIIRLPQSGATGLVD